MGGQENRIIKDWYHLPPFDNVAQGLADGVPVENGLTGRAVRTGKTVLLGDVSKSPEYLNVLPEVKSEMAIPVKIGETVVAVLDLESHIRNALDASDQMSMETLAHALATAIQNANSYHALERINAQLAETARMKDEIVQIVAHDFRSPLTVIRGYMDHLLKKEEWKDERQKEIMETVSAQAQRLQKRLAEATLKASRLDSGDLSFSMEKLDFQSFLQRLIFPWSEKHTFTLEVQPNLPLIHADAGRLQEVMENLLSNAIKNSPGGGKITIRAGSPARRSSKYVEAPDSDLFLLVSIVDEGIGIPADKRDLLFRRFTRIHDMRRIEGIGLGLYIAKKDD